MFCQTKAFKGRVKAPEETVDGKTVNSVFNMGQPASDDWTKAFIMRFTLGLPRTIDKKTDDYWSAEWSVGRAAAD